MSGFSEKELVFVSWLGEDWKTNEKKLGNYHLAQYQGGTIHTACGMLILTSSQQPDFADLVEPRSLQICSVCSTRSSDFSKRKFGGRKLKFRASTARTKKVSHESNEEMYRVDHKSEGELY